MRKGLRAGLLAGTVLAGLWGGLRPPPAQAQVQCSVLSQALLLLSFSDLVPTNAITPQSLRNFVCSVPSLANSQISLTLLGAVTGTGTSPITTTFGGIPAGYILANATGFTASPTGTALTTELDAAIGSTQGSVIYRGASGWLALGSGTNGQFLETQGSGSNPQWATNEHWASVATSSVNPLLTSTLLVIPKVRYTSLVIDAVDVSVAGTGSPAITLQLITNSGTMNCGGTTISASAGLTSAACTSGNTLTANGTLSESFVLTSGTVEPATVTFWYHTVP